MSKNVKYDKTKVHVYVLLYFVFAPLSSILKVSNNKKKNNIFPIISL